MISRAIVLTAACLAALCGGTARAAGTPPVTTLPTNLQFFTTTGGGPIDPGVLVGFNPQPDPPGDNAMPDLTDPSHPTITQTGLGYYTVLFGLDDGSGTPYTFTPLGSLPTVRTPTATFMATNGTGAFEVTIDLSGMNGDAVGFNPQPDPPGDYANSFVGMEFYGDPMMSWTLDYGTLDPNGGFVPNGLLSFQEVPEPASLALLGVALGGLSLVRRRAGQSSGRPT